MVLSEKTINIADYVVEKLGFQASLTFPGNPLFQPGIYCAMFHLALSINESNMLILNSMKFGITSTIGESPRIRLDCGNWSINNTGTFPNPNGKVTNNYRENLHYLQRVQYMRM